MLSREPGRNESCEKDTGRAKCEARGESEMRKQLVTVLLLMLVMALITASAQTQGAGTDAPRHAALQKVSVVRTADGVSVEIRAHGTVKPRLSTLDNPARIVVDLPNTVVATAHGLISVNGDGVKDVRLGMDGRSTPTSRIVVDLTQACRHELVSGSDNSLVLKLYTKPALAKAAPLVVKAQPAVAKSEVAVAPPVAQTVAPATEARLIQTSARATDFAFIEPSYRPKDSAASDDTKPAVVDPSARATAAAGKFAVRPEGNLLPAASAAMQSSGMQPAVNMAAEQKVQAAQAPAITGPKYTGEPISVNLKDVDLKDFFRLIHEISGLNVVLDPNVKGTLTIVLDDVPWDQALDIVLKNNDLSRQLEGNVLRIATVETMRKEAESRRGQIEAEALAVDKITVTRFLSYAHSKDVVPTLKKLLSSRGDIISDDRTNALIIQDIPTVIPELDRLIAQLDRKTQEVEIEARVVAATRTFARDIGTQLGFGWGDGKTAIGGASAVGTSPTTVGGLTPGYITAGSSTGGGSQIPLFSNFPVTSPTSGLTFVNASNNVRIDAILTMAESRGLLKILSRPRVVTQNNIQALVRQGVRVPIVTQAQLGGPPTVTYVDAFLRLTVVPQITSEGTIFLNVDVENTTPDFGRTVQGNPTLITQQATTQVLVTDGGTVVIGGVIQTQNSVTIAQVPLLGNIPMLGNLFKHTTVSTSNQELIFFITPRIIQT